MPRPTLHVEQLSDTVSVAEIGFGIVIKRTWLPGVRAYEWTAEDEERRLVFGPSLVMTTWIEWDFAEHDRCVKEAEMEPAFDCDRTWRRA